MIFFNKMLVFFVTTEIINAQHRSILDSLFIGVYRSYRQSVINTNGGNISSRNFKRNDFQKEINKTEQFPCSVLNFRSEKTPTSVHYLKPGDIDIIGAIGDSISTGYGIGSTNPYNIVKQNRGMVFAVGGQATWREFLTLPNILKLYNPKLFGYSLGPSLAINRDSQFNAAEDGAISEDLPYMTKVLISRIKADKRTDFKNHWKMITIFIGANDFCFQICYYKNYTEAIIKHKRDLLETLRLLRDHLPRTFVNLVAPPDVSLLKNFTNPPLNCLVSQRMLCPCFVGSRFEGKLKELQEVVRKFQMLQSELATYKEFDREDFTVAFQPFILKSTLPIGADGFTDRSYFALDCFHFSQRTHSEATKALWNNLQEPIGEKGLTFIVNKMKCPSETNPYLKTIRNSSVGFLF